MKEDGGSKAGEARISEHGVSIECPGCQGYTRVQMPLWDGSGIPPTTDCSFCHLVISYVTPGEIAWAEDTDRCDRCQQRFSKDERRISTIYMQRGGLDSTCVECMEKELSRALWVIGNQKEIVQGYLENGLPDASPQQREAYLASLQLRA